MSTSPHLVAPEEVMALLDGELSTDRAQSVSAHIEECADCRELANALRSNSHSLSNWTVPALPANPHFENSLSETARRISSESRSVSSFPVSAFLRRHWLLTAAASALITVLAFTLSTVSFRPMSALVPRQQSNFSVDFAQTDKLSSTKKSHKENLDRGAAQVNGLYQGWLAADDKATNVAKEKGLVSPEDRFPSTEASQAPMIARTVSLSIIAKDFGFSRTALDAILARHHGYAASLTASTQQNAARSLQASLRIPAAELNAAVVELKALGHVENETQNGEEVTQQHADLVARLKNSRETEQRLQAILEQRTGKISDVLAVEQEIARVRGGIEQMEAEQKSLEHRVDFATVDLTLAEEYKAQIGSPSPAISTRIHNALVAGYRDAVETLVGIALFLAADGPSILLWLAFLFPIAWLLRRLWLRANAAASAIGA